MRSTLGYNERCPVYSSMVGLVVCSSTHASNMIAAEMFKIPPNSSVVPAGNISIISIVGCFKQCNCDRTLLNRAWPITADLSHKAELCLE